MPIYEYRCDGCGLQKEFLQKMSDAPIAACPSCGQTNFKKMLSAAGFQLKGSGWYQTDFRGTGSKNKEKPAEAPAAAPACGAGACPACE